jgi:hypothetical protein
MLTFYVNPPAEAIVLCVDEKPSIQALERAQGYILISSPPGPSARRLPADVQRPHGAAWRRRRATPHACGSEANRI